MTLVLTVRQAEALCGPPEPFRAPRYGPFVVSVATERTALSLDRRGLARVIGGGGTRVRLTDAGLALRWRLLGVDEDSCAHGSVRDVFDVGTRKTVVGCSHCGRILAAALTAAA